MTVSLLFWVLLMFSSPLLQALFQKEELEALEPAGLWHSEPPWQTC